MPTILSKTEKGGLEFGELADLRDDLVQEKRRLERLLARVDNALRQAEETESDVVDTGEKVPAPRPSPLDQWKNVVDATKDLRVAKGLANVPVRELQATLVRRVSLGPLVESPVPDFLFTSGKAYRYNTRGIHCVYFAEDERTAAAEYERHNVSRHQPFVTYFAEVVLKRIIDLCSTE